MPDLASRVMRLQAAAWAVRRASPQPCALPFALVLMTEEARQPDLVSLVKRLPSAGTAPPVLIVFRHYGLPADMRAVVMRGAREAALARGHLFSVAGDGRAARPGDGAHNRRGGWPVSASVHSLGQARARRVQLRPDLGFVSPVFATASHPGAPSLGAVRAAGLAATTPYPCFALGGLDGASAWRLVGSPFQGIAAVGAWS